MTTQLTINRMGTEIGKALAEDGIDEATFARSVGCPVKRLRQVISGETAGKPAELDYWAYALGRSWTVALAVNSGK